MAGHKGVEATAAAVPKAVEATAAADPRVEVATVAADTTAAGRAEGTTGAATGTETETPMKREKKSVARDGSE